MPAQEIAFESLQYKIEATKGTAEAAPAFALNLEGTLTPNIEYYYPPDRIGTLSDIARAEVVRTVAAIEAEGAMDVNRLHHLATMAINGGVTTPTTPGTAVLSRLWTFIRAMTSDTFKSATWFWGDPNVRIWQGKYGLIQSLGLSGDASGTDGATMSISGVSHFTDIAAPTMAGVAVGPLISPARMQVWIDTSSAHGTTLMSGRVVSADLDIPTGITPKFVATGPAGLLTYDLYGITPGHPTLKLRLMMADLVQYNLVKAFTLLKIRVRWNGPLIENAGGTDFYYYVQADIVGKAVIDGWSDLEGTNRVIDLTIEGQYDTTLTSDLVLYVQNQKTNLTT